MTNEALFIEQLETDPLPVRELTRTIQQAVDLGHAHDAEAMAKLLQDVLAERDQVSEALDLLALRVQWIGDAAQARRLIRDDAAAVLGPDRRRRALLEHIGLDGSAPPPESVRRLHVLVRLANGALCYDRTWGFGIVRNRDDFERRFEIDFESRAGHRMTFAYAAETLRLLEEDHLLARWHRSPEHVTECVRDTPALVVRWALESFGPMPPAILQEHLSPRLVNPEDWKRFWDAARKELKKDPLVTLPSRRSDPIVVRDRPEDFGEEWAQTLAADCDMDSILERLNAWLESGLSVQATESVRAIVEERLVFVIKGAGDRKPGLVAQAALLADAGAISSPALNIPSLAAHLAAPHRLGATTAGLSARQRKTFFDFLQRHIGDALHDALLSLLPQMDMATFSEAMTILVQAGREQDCAEAFRALIATPESAPEALLWLVRNPGHIHTWGPPTAFEWARLLMNVLEVEQSGDRLKAQNALRDRVAKPDTLGALFKELSPAQQKELLLRLRDTPAWPQLERRALVGVLVKRFPELECVLSADNAGAPHGHSLPTAKVTSHRTYTQRQRQLQRLISEEIPANSKEIGVARSYGDLRENFEYKAAKDMQALLMTRSAEWERQLQEVHPTDFNDAPKDIAGPGTGVRIQRAKGPVETYYLLGLWDQDEALGIVSSDAKLAQALHGKRPGDAVHLPGDSGPEPAELMEILPLPPEIRAWIRDGDEAP